MSVSKFAEDFHDFLVAPSPLRATTKKINKQEQILKNILHTRESLFVRSSNVDAAPKTDSLRKLNQKLQKTASVAREENAKWKIRKKEMVRNEKKPLVTVVFKLVLSQ